MQGPITGPGEPNLNRHTNKFAINHQRRLKWNPYSFLRVAKLTPRFRNDFHQLIAKPAHDALDKEAPGRYGARRIDFQSLEAFTLPRLLSEADRPRSESECGRRAQNRKVGVDDGGAMEILYNTLSIFCARISAFYPRRVVRQEISHCEEWPSL